MNRTVRWIGVGLVFVLCLGVPGARAQQPVAAEPQAPSGTVQAPREVVPPLPVPRLVRFVGTLKDELGKPRTGVVGVTFAVYKEQEGGAALWLETQNVELDEQGHYTVLLGSSKSEGLPLELFTAGEPRWLGVQVNLPKEVEQSRVLLVSVPYALKAADADTLGGKPASVYLTTEQAGGGGTTGKRSASAGIISPAVSGTGSTNVVAKWLDNVGTLGNSQISDDGTNVNMPGNVGAFAYKFTGNAGAPTDATATIFNQANVGPVFSGLSFKVRTGAPVPADALSIDPNQNVSITGNSSIGGNASALAYKFTGNAGAPTDATATIFNQANVGPVFSGLSFKVRTGAPVPADALSIDPSQNVSVVKGNLKLSGAGSAIIFPNGTVMSSAAMGVGGGTITGVNAGTGLSGGGTTGGVTLGIANGGVTNALLGANSVTNANIADGSLTPAKITGGVATLGANTFAGNQNVIGGNLGVVAMTSGATGLSVQATDLSTANTAVNGLADGAGGTGVIGEAENGNLAIGVWGISSSGVAGQFSGNVNVTGSLSKAGGSFKIDHPVDPANKYLYHSFVESPDMKNIYDGVANLDTQGEAVVQLPAWFGVLNKEFRYQLTCIGGFAPVYIAEEISQNRFKIAGGKPGMKISWMVTGIRQDAWANAHRIPVEEEKTPQERGYYLHPDLYGQPPQKSTEWATHAEIMTKKGQNAVKSVEPKR
jgi:hypothetical protein